MCENFCLLKKSVPRSRSLCIAPMAGWLTFFNFFFFLAPPKKEGSAEIVSVPCSPASVTARPCRKAAGLGRHPCCSVDPDADGRDLKWAGLGGPVSLFGPGRRSWLHISAVVSRQGVVCVGLSIQGEKERRSETSASRNGDADAGDFFLFLPRPLLSLSGLDSTPTDRWAVTGTVGLPRPPRG